MQLATKSDRWQDWSKPIPKKRLRAKPKTALEKSEDFAAFGDQVATALEDAIFHDKPVDHERLTAYAQRLRLCANRGNIWLGQDLHTSNGELYDASGRFWTCGHKLCPYCTAQTARRRRQKVREAVNRQRLFVGEHLKFITLTITNPEQSLLKTRDLVYQAWTRFRKLKWFKAHILGAAKDEEFTLTAKGFHYHIHLLARTKYIFYSTLRHHWTECVRSVFEENGLEFSPATADKMLIVKCDAVTSRERSIAELCKYITKTDSWTKLESRHLIDVARTRRFPRMQELIGTFRPPTEQNTDPEPTDANTKTIVHTTRISDGATVSDWRDEVDSLGVVQYLAQLEETVNERATFRTEQLKRKYQFAVFDWPHKTQPIDTTLLIARLNSIAEHQFSENRRRRLYRYNSRGIRYRL